MLRLGTVLKLSLSFHLLASIQNNLRHRMQLNNGTCMQQLVKMLAVITNYLVITMQEALDRNSHVMRLV